MTTLVIAEHDHASIKPATLNTLSAAQQLGQEIDILVVGHNARPAAQAAAQIPGVRKVLLADAEQFADHLAENLAHQVLALATPYSHILFASTSTGKSAMPRVAAQLDVAALSDIISVESPDTFKRMIYAGAAVATVQASDAVKVLSVRSTGFQAVAASGGDALIEPVPAVAGETRTTFIKREIVKSDRPELSSAAIVIAGGRGLGSADNFKLLTDLADHLGAAVGASRAAVDAGFAPNDWQIGQTGRIVAPQLYIAVGISGAVQHLAGMKDSKVIVAINQDPEAPIFGVADYGLVGDLFQIVPQLITQLSHNQTTTQGIAAAE